MSTANSGYCYDSVLRVINTGVVNKIDNASAEAVFEGWSPNNVRRLVVSPNGFAVQFHITQGTKVGKLLRIVPFNRLEILVNCFESDDYRPMITALTGKRVCSSIEEIVVLTQSLNPLVNTFPLKQECDIDSLIGTTDSIESRFPRLCSFLIINDTINDFLERYRDKLTDSFYQLAFDPDLDDYGKVLRKKVFTKEWWNHTALRGKYYTLDRPGNPLDRHFEDIRVTMQEKHKKKKLQDIENDILSDTFVSLRSIDSNLLSILSLFVVFEKLVRRHIGRSVPDTKTVTEFMDKLGEVLRAHTVHKHTLSKLRHRTQMYCTCFGLQTTDVFEDQVSARKRDVETLKSLVSKLYGVWLGYFAKIARYKERTAPISFRVALGDCKFNIPPQYDSLFSSEIKRSDHIRVSESLCNIMSVLSKMLLVVSDLTSAYCTPEFWGKVMSGEELS